MVTTSAPCACAASTLHDFTARPSTCTVHAPHCAVSQPTCVPVRPQVVAQELDEQRARIDVRADGLAVDGQGDGQGHGGLRHVLDPGCATRRRVSGKAYSAARAANRSRAARRAVVG